MTGIVQSATIAYPVTYRDPPPEGYKALPVHIVLSPTAATYGQLFNLTSLLMSQIATAVINNTQCTLDIAVTLGNNDTLYVPAGMGLIAPVFSTGSAFNVLVQAATTPSQSEIVEITLLNYNRNSGSWSYQPIQANIVNATIPVSGNINANITNASLAVVGNVNANITNASLDVSGSAVSISTGSVNAAITNANIAIQGVAGTPTPVTIAGQQVPYTQIGSASTTVGGSITAILAGNSQRLGANFYNSGPNSCIIYLRDSGLVWNPVYNLAAAASVTLYQITGEHLLYLPDIAAASAGTSTVYALEFKS